MFSKLLNIKEHLTNNAYCSIPSLEYNQKPIDSIFIEHIHKLYKKVDVKRDSTIFVNSNHN